MSKLILGLPSVFDTECGPDDLVVRQYTHQDAPRYARELRVALDTESGFKKLLGGFYVRCVTVQEIVHQFGGTPFSEIILNWPDQNRMIFWALQGSLLTTEGPLQRLVMPLEHALLPR